MTGRRSAALTTDLCAGALIAFLSVGFSLSYAVLLFAGTTPETQARGLVMMLTGSLVAAVVGTRLSSLPFSILFADGTLIALLASVAADVVADMAGASEAVIASTLAVLLMLATAVTGAALWLIGLLRGGSVVRFIPFQVTAGVLAASGWSPAIGGVSVSLGHAANLAAMADQGAAAKLVLGVLLGLSMLAVSTRLRNPVALPALILATITLYHAAAAYLDWPIAAQREAGWLVALPAHLDLVVPWSPDMLARVNWPALARHAVGLLALVPVTAICLLLGISAIETASGQDASADRDLKANGIAAMACAALGGVLGITSASRSILVYGMGVRGSGASLFAGLLGALVPMLWPGLLGLVPRFVLGGLLLFAGFSMLHHWLLRSRRRLTWSEYVTVLLVLAVAARFGLIAGAFSGLLLGCISFAVIYSHTSPIRASYRGDVARSNVDRPEPEELFLAAQGDTLLVMHLQGFVFFGTATRLADAVRRQIAATPGVLRHLILEFSNVQGIDGSALASFERLLRVTDAERIAVVLAAMSPAVASRLSALPRAGVRSAGVESAATLDVALERREAALLAGIAPAPLSLHGLLTAEFGQAGELAAFLDCLEAAEFPAGVRMMLQGEMSDELMFIEQGRASVTVQFRPDADPMRVRVYGAGAMVGEIGFCLGLPRTATVTADERCRVLRLTRSGMERLELEHPATARAFQRAVLRRLSKRLINKDQLIAALIVERAG